MKQETSTKKFNTDLLIGKTGEEIVAQILSKRNYFSAYEINDNSDYDFIALDGKLQGIKFEVKYDQYEDTGNMAIEFFCLKRFKPTGIAISKSHYYCYIFAHSRECYIIKSQVLKSLIANLPRSKIVSGGDNNHSVLVLIPYKQFRNSFKLFKY